MWIICIRHEQIISLVWTNGDNFGFGINNSDPVWIKLFRFFSDYWSFEDKVGLISFTRNYAGPFQGIFVSSVSNWRTTQWLLPDRDTRNASRQNWPFHVISVKVISVIIGNSLKNLLWSFTWHNVNNSMTSKGLSAFFCQHYDYDWVCVTIDSSYVVRDVIIIIFLTNGLK